MTTITPKPHRLSSPLLLLLGVIAMSVMTGCRNELYDMEYGEPLEKSNFFPDKRMSRQLVPGTVAYGHLREDSLLYTGKDASGADATVFPMEIGEKEIRRGQERYNIYCAPCHGRTGHGDGIVVQRGMKQPPSFHDARLQQAPAGYFYNVITNGFGVMYSYASRVKPEDRWKIIAYIRAIQKTGGAPAANAAAAPAAADTTAAATAAQSGTDTAGGTTESTGNAGN